MPGRYLAVDICVDFLFLLIGLRMQPICPSGEERGKPSRPKASGVVRAQANAEPRPGCFCPQGLVLTDDGLQAPKQTEDDRRAQNEPCSANGPQKRPVRRKGWKPHGRDCGLGSQQPGPQGASRSRKHTILAGCPTLYKCHGSSGTTRLCF